LNKPIRSYVLRQGRTTPAQQRALDDLLPKYGIPFGQPIASRNPLVLEIGSGMGETTSEIAKAHPETDFVAIEVHGPGVGSLLNRIEKEQIRNLRVVRHDAVEVLERMVADGSLAAVHLFFPDPWPKKRHHKRRLVQPAFVAELARVLKPGGLLHVATDWSDYAEHSHAVLSSEARFVAVKNYDDLCHNPLAFRPPTKFERRGRRLGHDVVDFFYRKSGAALGVG
jgi:tRNA (guanine-N7-)-methyltransferase